jgi:hypothetical protein
LSQKPDENVQNGEVFDPEAYLRNVEQFEDVEVVISGRNSVRIDRKQVKTRVINHVVCFIACVTPGLQVMKTTIRPTQQSFHCKIYKSLIPLAYFLAKFSATKMFF